MQDASNVLHVLILGEKVCLQCCSKLFVTKHWVTEIVRKRVPGKSGQEQRMPDDRTCCDNVRAKMLMAVQQFTRYWGALLTTTGTIDIQTYHHTCI